jgi:hypothetical protein
MLVIKNGSTRDEIVEQIQKNTIFGKARCNQLFDEALRYQKATGRSLAISVDQAIQTAYRRYRILVYGG